MCLNEIWPVTIEDNEMTPGSSEGVLCYKNWEMVVREHERNSSKGTSPADTLTSNSAPLQLWKIKWLLRTPSTGVLRYGSPSKLIQALYTHNWFFKDCWFGTCSKWQHVHQHWEGALVWETPSIIQESLSKTHTLSKSQREAYILTHTSTGLCVWLFCSMLGQLA